MRTELGEADSSGRRRPVPVANSEHSIRIDLVIEAIGEELASEAKDAIKPVEITDAGLVKIDPQTGMTSYPGVFAAGDLVNGGQTVVRAIAEGRDVAVRVGQHLRERPAVHEDRVVG